MMKIGLSVEEAVEEVLNRVRPAGFVELHIRDSFRSVLAEDIFAIAPVPPFDRSMMDGFAVRAADVRSASPEQPVRLRVRGRIGAGEVSGHVLQAGEAIRIMTGAPIPKGADAVARFEATDAQRNPDARYVQILWPVEKGEAISVAGEDIADGARVLAKGAVIGAAEMALLAAAGVPTVRVYRKPVIGVLSSGRELADVGVPLSYGKIYNSNTYMLAGLISAWGGIPYLLGRVDDEADAVAEAIRTAMPAVDGLVTTGGVSVGDFDVMRAAYQAAGGRIHFWKVNMRPGTPFTFAEIQNKPVMGLSGNPAAGYVNAMLFLQPAIRAMAGLSQPRNAPVPVTLAEDPQVKVIGMDRFLRARIVIEAGEANAYPLPFGQSAGVMSTLSGIQGFVRIRAKTGAKKGDLVEAYLLDMPQAGGELN